MMRDPIAAILNAIERDEGGLAVIWYPDLGLREWIVDEVASVVDEERKPFRARSVERAMGKPNRLALLMPNDEREAVLELEGNRDRLLNGEKPRTQPIVLFLIRDGDGQRALAEEAISISGWLKGNQADPEEEAQIDVEEERRLFQELTKQTPEAWLKAWHQGELLQTSENFHLLYRAKLLEES